MLSRLGNALYWIALLVGGLFAALAIIGSKNDFPIFAFFAFLFALVGWIARYVLTGRKDVYP